MSSGSVSDGDCVVSVNKGNQPDIVQIGPFYDPSNVGSENTPPDGLELLLALIDRRPWPLQVCGDQGIGKNATPWGAVDNQVNTYTAIDAGPIPDSPFPAEPPVYPGVGITAYGCKLNCDYTIVGNLGADVIVAKIDGQYQILRVLGSASTTPLFGPSNDCRCCGNSLKSTKLRARILTVLPAGCGPYRACDEFSLDPVSSYTGLNPLAISISCNSSPTSSFEDINDWVAFALGSPAEILTLKCCTEYVECEAWYSSENDSTSNSVSGSDSTDDETCLCANEDIIDPNASGSLSESVSEYVCRFEATIRIPASATNPCEYTVKIFSEEDDACEEFDDVNEGDPVIMEACGLPDLPAETRVIMARIPGGIPGRTALDGVDPVEWFLIRACSTKDCENPCDEPPPEGPLCCGEYCSDMPQTLSVSITMLVGDLNCTPPVGVTVEKWGGGISLCDGASDTRWSLVAPIPDNTLCPGTTNCPDPQFEYPTWLDIERMEIICGGQAGGDICGNSGSTSGSDSGDVEGPQFSLVMGGGLETGDVPATQNLIASCCNPLYLEYEITGQFGMVAGAGCVPIPVTLRLVVTE